MVVVSLRRQKSLFNYLQSQYLVVAMVGLKIIQSKDLFKLWMLKVPKCENFHRTDFFKFYTIKPLWVGDFRVKIKYSKF